MFLSLFSFFLYFQLGKMDEAKKPNTHTNYGSFSKNSSDNVVFVDPGQERLNQLGYKQVKNLTKDAF